MQGQIYAEGAGGSETRMLFPLAFCRECGQEYYFAGLLRDGEIARLVPRSPLLSATDEDESEPGYFVIEQDGL
jgi:hypothetical protein